MATLTPRSYADMLIHHYAASLLAIQYPSSSKPSPSTATNYLILSAGMGDTLLSLAYTHQLAALLPPQWALVYAQYSSSGSAWGTCTLEDDVRELGLLVTYLREQQQHQHQHPGGKIVLMGHSTGCQDVVSYLLALRGSAGRGMGTGLEHVDGAILQAPVSDREYAVQRCGIEKGFVEDPWEPFREANAMARSWMEGGRGDDVLPLGVTEFAFGRDVWLTARRWWDVISPGPEHDGRDDLFSSDLGEERERGIWGGLLKQGRVLVLYGELDETRPRGVDLVGMVDRWCGFMKGSGVDVDPGSGVVPGADHALSSCGDEVRRDVFNRVMRLLEAVDNMGRD